MLTKIVGVGTVALAGAFVMLLLLIRKRTSAHEEYTINYGRKKNPLAVNTFRLLTSIPIIKTSFFKLRKKYEMLYPADEHSIDRKVSSVLLTAIGAGAASFAAMLVMSKGDIFFICMAFLMTYVMFKHSLTTSYNSMEKKLLEQFASFLSNLRQKYHDNKLLDEALYASLENLPYEIGLHIQKIYDIVIAPDRMEEVEKYVPSAPNRYLMTFAAICVSIQEYGDKKINEKSLFTTNINYLKEELDIELLKKQKNSFLFSGMTFVVLLPVFLLKPTELVMKSIIPELAQWFQSAGGTISIVLTFVITLIMYEMVTSLRDGQIDASNEVSGLKKIAELPGIQNLLTAYENHNWTKTQRIGDQLKMTGDNSGTQVFLVKRILMGLVCIIAVNTVSGVVVAKTRANLYSNFQKTFENSVVPNNEYREIMEDTAKEYVSLYAGTPYSTASKAKTPEEVKADLVAQISNRYGMKEVYASEVAEVVLNRAQSLSNTYYKWWMLLISLIAGVIGFNIPMLLLKNRVSVMRMSMEDEVIQFQTLILILMYEDGVTMDVVLSWMERFAFVFRDSIRKCIVNIEMNQKQAIEDMRNSETFPDFQRFCDGLLASLDVGIAAAFDDVLVDRDYYKNKRAQDNEEMMQKKSNKAGLYAFIPYGCALLGHVLIPFGVFGYQLFIYYKSFMDI